MTVYILLLAVFYQLLERVPSLHADWGVFHTIVPSVLTHMGRGMLHTIAPLVLFAKKFVTKEKMSTASFES